MEELALTSGPVPFGRRLWGNSQKRSEKDGELHMGSKVGGPGRHMEGT